MTKTVSITVEIPVDEAAALLNAQASLAAGRGFDRFRAAVVAQYKPTPEPAVGQVWGHGGPILSSPRVIVSVRHGNVVVVDPRDGEYRASMTWRMFVKAYTFLAHTEAEWEATQ